VTVGAVSGTDGLRGVCAGRDFARGEIVVSFPLKRAVGLGMATQTAQARTYNSRNDTAAAKTRVQQTDVGGLHCRVAHVCVCPQNAYAAGGRRVSVSTRARGGVLRALNVSSGLAGACAAAAAQARGTARLVGRQPALLALPAARRQPVHQGVLARGAPAAAAGLCPGAPGSCRCCRTLLWGAERQPHARARGRAPHAPAAGSRMPGQQLLI